MKASEIIKAMQERIDEEGDVEVSEIGICDKNEGKEALYYSYYIMEEPVEVKEGK